MSLLFYLQFLHSFNIKTYKSVFWPTYIKNNSNYKSSCTKQPTGGSFKTVTQTFRYLFFITKQSLFFYHHFQCIFFICSQNSSSASTTMSNRLSQSSASSSASKQCDHQEQSLYWIAIQQLPQEPFDEVGDIYI